MPIGSLSVYPEVIRLTLLNNPKRVLDVGIGYGMNGAGIRNWFSDAVSRIIDIVGIEPFKNYDNPNWKHYNKVINDDLLSAKIDGLFDVIICTDVCEHWADNDIKDNVDKLKSLLNPNGVILMSTPAIWIEQGAYAGNEYERHKSMWSSQRFFEHGFHMVRDENYKDIYGHMMLLAEFINR